MTLLTAEQRELRQKIADDLRTDSDAVRIHVDLSKYLAADPDNPGAGLWTDTVDVPIRDIRIEIESGKQAAYQDAHDYLIRILELKIKGMIPRLCKQVLYESARRAEKVMQGHGAPAVAPLAPPGWPDGLNIAEDLRDALA